MRAEPKPRRDGRCARPGCENERVADDAFCSSSCAKDFFGVENRSDQKARVVSPASKRMINNSVPKTGRN